MGSLKPGLSSADEDTDSPGEQLATTPLAFVRKAIPFQRRQMTALPPRLIGALLCSAAAVASAQDRDGSVAHDSRGSIGMTLVFFGAAVLLGIFLAGRNLRFHQERAARMARLRKAAETDQTEASKPALGLAKGAGH